jgi:hypothetical protein
MWKLDESDFARAASAENKAASLGIGLGILMAVMTLLWLARNIVGESFSNHSAS